MLTVHATVNSLHLFIRGSRARSRQTLHMNQVSKNVFTYVACITTKISGTIFSSVYAKLCEKALRIKVKVCQSLNRATCF